MDEETSEDLAWLATDGGSLVVGHGPFEKHAVRPEGRTAFFVTDFALSEDQPWRVPSRVEVMDGEEFAARQGLVALEVEWEPLDAVPFSEVFQEVMDAIRAGGFEKTVPVVVERGRATGDPRAGCVAAVARQRPPLRPYGWCGRGAGFAGATPELLVMVAGGRLRTMALAGTAKQEDRDAFAVDEKEIREHEYVAQTLVAKLLGLGEARRHGREILDLGGIVHFLTMIGVDLLEEQEPGDLIRRLHPTPALGPLPRTGETLEALLGWRRRLGCPPEFGSPFGLWHEGVFEAVVAIRGLWWRGDELRVPAGCGVIEASRLVNEWRELRLKRDTVKRFLEPAGLR